MNSGGPFALLRSAVPQFPNGLPLPSLISFAQSSGPLRGCSIAYRIYSKIIIPFIMFRNIKIREGISWPLHAQKTRQNKENDGGVR